MDPKVCGKLLTTHGEGYDDDDDEGLRDGSPSGGAPEQAPRWDLHGNRSCGGGIRVFSLFTEFLGYVDLYRKKEGTGGRSRGTRGRGRAPHPRGPALDPLTWFSSSACVIFSKNNSREGFIPFRLRLIFFFFETLKQAKNSNSGLGLRLIG